MTNIAPALGPDCIFSTCNVLVSMTRTNQKPENSSGKSDNARLKRPLDSVQGPLFFFKFFRSTGDVENVQNREKQCLKQGKAGTLSYYQKECPKKGKNV